MVDAIVGAVIMVVATTSLFLAIEVAEKAMNNAGRYCLTPDEIKTLNDAGLTTQSQLDEFWSQNLSNAPTHLDSARSPASSNSTAEQCIN